MRNPAFLGVLLLGVFHAFAFASPFLVGAQGLAPGAEDAALRALLSDGRVVYRWCELACMTWLAIGSVRAGDALLASLAALGGAAIGCILALNGPSPDPVLDTVLRVVEGILVPTGVVGVVLAREARAHGDRVARAGALAALFIVAGSLRPLPAIDPAAWGSSIAALLILVAGATIATVVAWFVVLRATRRLPSSFGAHARPR